jgi:hypothetical protein
MEGADSASAGLVVLLVLVVFLFLVTADNSSSRWNGGVTNDGSMTTAMLVLLIACASLVLISLCMCWFCSMFGSMNREGNGEVMDLDEMGMLCCR